MYAAAVCRPLFDKLFRFHSDFTNQTSYSLHYIDWMHTIAQPGVRAVGDAPVNPAAAPAPVNKAPSGTVSVPLIVLFGIQLLLIVGAFSGITAMFTTTQQSQIDSSVRSIAVKSLEVSANYIINPLSLHKQSSTQVIHTLRSNPQRVQVQNLNASNMVSLGLEFATLRTALLGNAFAAYAYQEYDTGVTSSIDPSLTAVLEVVAGHSILVSCDATATQRYLTITDDVPNEPSLFNYTITNVIANYTPASAGYVQTALRTNTTSDAWTLPYLWQDAYSTTILLSYLQCITNNPATGGCLNAYGQDMDLTYVTTIIGNFGSTPSSVVTLVDLRGMIVMASSDPAVTSLVDGAGNPWSAVSSPSTRSNAAVARFLALCPNAAQNALSCPKMVESDATRIYAAIAVSPFAGVALALVDVSDRSYYYDTADRSRTVAIVVVVVVSFMIAAFSVLTFLGVSRPVASLIDAFVLAADLKNEEVVPVAPLLAELQVLSRAFDKMNAKLLAARAYMPQSMLGNDEDGDNDDAASEGTATEGDVQSSATSKSTAASRALLRQASGRHDAGEHMLSDSDQPSSAFSKRSGGRSGTFGSQLASAALGLVEKRCTILAINIVGLHALLADRATAETDFSQWLGMLQTVVKQEKGVIDTFHGDRVIVTFNSSNSVSAHVRRGALCALAISKATAKTAFRTLSIGLGSSRALVGSLGTASLRGFATMGHGYTHACHLERIAKQISVLHDGADRQPAIVIPDSVVEECRTFACTYTVGHSKLLSSRVHVLACALERGQDDEWLYEMQDAASKNPFAVVSEVVQLASSGDAVGAADCLAKATALLSPMVHHNSELQRSLHVAQMVVERRLVPNWE